MNIAQIKEELQREKQSLKAEREAAFRIAPPGEYQAANYQRREGIILRFEYLLFMLEQQQNIEAKQTKEYMDQRAEIKSLTAMNESQERGLKKVMDERDEAKGHAQDFHDQVEHQKAEIRNIEKFSDARYDSLQEHAKLIGVQKKTIVALEQSVIRKKRIIEKYKAADVNCRRYEDFFESLKQIIKETHDTGEEEENSSDPGLSSLF